MNEIIRLAVPEPRTQTASGAVLPNGLRWKLLHPWAFPFISLLAVIPCLWQPRIHSVDLPSHTYNAWLISLLEREPVHGLIVNSIWTNVLFDHLLSAVAHITGFAAAETIVVAGAVLVFVWGVLSLICRLNGRAGWACTPLVLAVAYGYTFRFGFLNFYLATGLSALAVAVWSRQPWRMALTIAILAIAAVGNPMPPTYVGLCAAYWRIATRLPQDFRIPALFCCAVWLASLGRAITGVLPAAWSPEQIVGKNAALQLFGFDQLWVYGSEYHVLAWTTFCIAMLGILTRLRHTTTYLRQPLVQLLLLNAVTIGMFPSAIQVSEAAAPIAFISERMSLFSAIYACVLVAKLENRQWLQAAVGLAAVTFFVLTFTYDVQLNKISRRLQAAVDTVPARARVLALITTSDLRLNPFGHTVDRACMEHCFSFANYEPASRHFRIKAVDNNAIAIASPGDVRRLEQGEYIVKRTDAPIYGMCRCDQPGGMCAVELKAGQRPCELRVDVWH